MALFNRQYAYSVMDKEDPEDMKHRTAQFLIYKAMQTSDRNHGTRRRPTWLRVKIFKLKIKIGKRLKKLRKGFSSTLFSAKADFCKQVACALKSCKHLLHGKQGPILVRTLPPIF